MAVESSVTVEFDRPVEMRDGVRLRADVYRPSGGGRHPVLLQRTPYDKSCGALALLQTDTLRAVRSGYAVVIQDCRGRYASDGTFAPFHQEVAQEVADGYDSVEWCAARPWADGNVGMYGASYVGAVQWLAAVAQPPGLRRIAPTFTASDDYEGWTCQGGAFQWGFMCTWVLPFLTAADLKRANARGELADDAYRHLAEQVIGAVDRMGETVTTLPLGDIPVSPEWSPYFREWMSHSSRDDFWRSCGIEERHGAIAVPALNVGGWYDVFLAGTVRNFLGVRRHGAAGEARRGSRLLVGPWTHATPPPGQSGAVDFGLRAGHGISPIAMDVDGEQLRFFDRWLKGVDDGAGDDRPVRIFVMGEGAWRDEAQWPPEGVRSEEFFLRGGGNANSSRGDGELSTVEPGDERPDAYLYDPRHPVPTVGGQLCCYPPQLPPGAFDQRPVEARPDVLVFTSAPLARDLEVAGPVALRPWAATSAADTDFTAKLVDVAEDGYARNPTDGIVRARFRNGLERPCPVEPGIPTEYAIDLGATSNLFRRGHRIALEVTSSNFPRFDRNPNTGNEPGHGAEPRPAAQTVFHDRERPSRPVLPTVPR